MSNENDVSKLSDTIVPKSDQLNAEQLLSGPMDIKVTGVSRGGTSEQPITISYEGDNGRPYKPCKSMRKVLIFAWGDDGREWVGKSMRLYCDDTVVYGGVKVGGVRISHLSHIERDIAILLTKTRGKKQEFIIKKLEPKKEPEIFGQIRAAKTLEELTELKPKMSGVSGAMALAKKRAEEIKAASEPTE